MNKDKEKEKEKNSIYYFVNNSISGSIYSIGNVLSKCQKQR